MTSTEDRHDHVDPHLTVLDAVDSAPEPGAGRRASVLSGGLWSAASQVVPAAGTAVLSVAAGRLLGTAELGQQSLIAYVNAAVSAVLVISLNTALLQVGGRLQGEQDVVALRQLMRWAIGAHLLAGVVVLVAMVLTGELTMENRLAWAVVGVVSVLDALADALAVRLILVEGWGPIGRLRLVFQLIGPVLGVGFVLAGAGITGIFVGDGLAALGLSLAGAQRFRRMGRRLTPALLLADPSYRPPSVDDARDAPGGSELPSYAALRPTPAGRAALYQELARGRSGPARTRRHGRAQDDESGSGLWRAPVPVARTFSLFAVGQLITQIVSKRVEFVVLALFIGDVAVGTYSVAFMAVSLVTMIPLGIATAAMPLVAAAEGRGEIGSAVTHLRFALRVGTAVTVPLAALLAALGPFAVIAVYGTAYLPAAQLVPLASAALLPAVAGGVCTQFWSGRGRLGVVLTAGSIAGIVDLAVALGLVPVIGVIGAVAANVAGQFALAAALLVVTVRQFGAVGWRVRELGAAIAVGVAAAAAAVLVWLAVDALVGVGAELRAVIVLVVGGVAGVAAAVAAGLVLRPLSAAEGDWIAGMLPNRMRSAVRRLSRRERAS